MTTEKVYVCNACEKDVKENNSLQLSEMEEGEEIEFMVFCNYVCLMKWQQME